MYQRIRWKTPNQPWASTCTCKQIHTPEHPHIRTHIPHTHTYDVYLKKKKTLMHTSSNIHLVAAFLKGTFQMKHFINVLQLPANELGQGLGAIFPLWQAHISVTVPAGVPGHQWCFKHDSIKRSVSRQPREISRITLVLSRVTHGLPDASLCLAPSPIPSCKSLPSFLTRTKCSKFRRCFRFKVQNSV